MNQGNKALAAQIVEAIITTGQSCLCSQPLPPKITPNVIANLDLLNILNQLIDEATIADEFPGITQNESPKPIATFRVTALIPIHPFPHSLAIKGCSIKPHHFRVAKNC